MLYGNCIRFKLLETAQTFKTVFTECIDKMNISQDVATSSKESDGLGYALHKQAFIDATCFRYGWRPSNLPTNFVCGKPFTVDHALSCCFAGFHNSLYSVRNLSWICGMNSQRLKIEIYGIYFVYV